MEWCYQQWGEAIYSNLEEYKKDIHEYIKQEEININPKQKNALFESKTWNNQL